jgi:hypothetical protein
MMETVTVPIKKEYSIALPTVDPWGSWNDQRTSATLAVRFKNDRSSELGIPLPSGAIRVYAPETEGEAYIGAAEIADTPKNQSVYLTLSNVFDVFSEASTVSTKKVDKHTVRKSVKVTVHNEKKHAVQVRLAGSIYSAGGIQEESVKSVKLNSYQRQWMLDVPAEGQRVLTYSVYLRVLLKEGCGGVVALRTVVID